MKNREKLDVSVHNRRSAAFYVQIVLA